MPKQLSYMIRMNAYLTELNCRKGTISDHVNHIQTFRYVLNAAEIIAFKILYMYMHLMIYDFPKIYLQAQKNAKLRPAYYAFLLSVFSPSIFQA